MSEDQKQPLTEIKVTDRRSFTSSGERRAPNQSEAEAPRRSAATAPATLGKTEETPPGVDFQSFIHYLGQVAMQQIVGMRNPTTGEVVASLEDARQTIEILQMLQHKTRGNLSPRETEFLKQLIYELKLEFARRSPTAKR